MSNFLYQLATASYEFSDTKYSEEFQRGSRSTEALNTDCNRSIRNICKVPKNMSQHVKTTAQHALINVMADACKWPWRWSSTVKVLCLQTVPSCHHTDMLV